jgi:DHA2 family multidrug resistance protein
MLEELLNYPVDTTGYMTIPRGVTLVGGVVLMSLVPQVDYRLFLIGGMALVVYANWLMLGYSPAMDWRPVAEAGLLQGAGLGMLTPELAKAAFGTLDPKLRPKGSALINLSRLYGSTIGIAVVQIFFYGNTQAVHVALAKDLTPYRTAAHVAGSIAKPGLAALNGMITHQAAVVAVIGQFEILMFGCRTYTREYEHDNIRYASLYEDSHPRIWGDSRRRVWHAHSESSRNQTGHQGCIGSGISTPRLCGTLP